MMVLSDTEGVLVKVGVEVTVAIWVVGWVGVAVGFTGDSDCVQPLARTRKNEDDKKHNILFHK